jgi:hypothetical protein
MYHDKGCGKERRTLRQSKIPKRFFSGLAYFGYPHEWPAIISLLRVYLKTLAGWF